MAPTRPSATETVATLTANSWTQHPDAAKLVHRLLNECLEQCPFAASLSRRMLDETGTRMVDWIDHFGLTNNDSVIPELERVGYVEIDPIHGDSVWHHTGGLFPCMRRLSGMTRHLAIKVESVVDFLFAHELSETTIEGEPFASLRCACVGRGGNVEFWVVERHGNRDFEPNLQKRPSIGDVAKAAANFGTAVMVGVLGGGAPAIGMDEGKFHEQLANRIGKHFEALLLRRREFANDADGFRHANTLIDAAIADLGRDRACDLFFAAEREYWLRRNRAGQIQLARQKVLGLGWANHDHHTYRSSRESFVSLIAFLEKLGFVCRERFYAGREAGWGAQVIEHHGTGVTIFADVDMSPEELAQDFSHLPLVPRKELGTVGLWCALHGEAFLQAGMHHLECQFDFAATRDQLKQAGIETMPPFTDFPFLRQAFTRGEQWPVAPNRVERLRAANKITDQQAQQFVTNGALGSHLEILQRDDGYKGFNQTGINEIIAATDPRRNS